MTRRRLIVVAALVAVTLFIAWWLADDRGDGLLARLLRQDATWQTMQSRGTWRVGLDPSFPPFESLDAAGAAIGYDLDLARALAADWDLTAEIVPIGYDSLVDALRAGRIDSVVSALPYDPLATRDVFFSPPYFEAGVRLAVVAGSPITGVAQLAGRQVAVEWGSMGDMAGRRLQRDGLDLTLVPFATPDEAVDALLVDPSLSGLFIDQVSLRQAQGRGAELVAVGPALESNPYVIAAPRQATRLHEQLSASLTRFAADGTLARLEERWFGPLPPAVQAHLAATATPPTR
jgi:ABC-type amino acid transport substrate-binding protein